MGIPNVLLDNNYGKLKSFYETWTKNCEGSVFANSLEEGLEVGRSLARKLNEFGGSEF
jgi:exopolysaccharide biosynthesis predicted pyruvyltransferase EpsI